MACTWKGIYSARLDAGAKFLSIKIFKLNGYIGSLTIESKISLEQFRIKQQQFVERVLNIRLTCESLETPAHRKFAPLDQWVCVTIRIQR